MTDKPLKPSQKAFLMLLMSEAREVSNTELTERYGVSLTGEDSRELVNQKLATVRKIGRANAHELTDLGWVRCKHELTTDYVKATGPAFPALHALLGAVDRYLDRADLSLANLFTASAAPAPAEPVRTAAKPVGKIDVAARIRNAYKKLRSESTEWVSLADLRDNLAAIPAADIDVALTKMALARKIRLIPEENQKTLTAADRAAAVNVGGEDKHLLSIGAA
jgi:hypothetical protein